MSLGINDLVSSIPTDSTNYDVGDDWSEVLSVQVVWGSTTAAFSYQLQVSNNGTDYTNIGSSQAILNDSGSTFTQINGTYNCRYVRVALTKTSGALTSWKIIAVTEQRRK